MVEQWVPPPCCDSLPPHDVSRFEIPENHCSSSPGEFSICSYPNAASSRGKNARVESFLTRSRGSSLGKYFCERPCALVRLPEVELAPCDSGVRKCRRQRVNRWPLEADFDRPLLVIVVAEKYPDFTPHIRSYFPCGLFGSRAYTHGMEYPLETARTV